MFNLQNVAPTFGAISDKGKNHILVHSCEKKQPWHFSWKYNQWKIHTHDEQRTAFGWIIFSLIFCWFVTENWLFALCKLFFFCKKVTNFHDIVGVSKSSSTNTTKKLETIEK